MNLWENVLVALGGLAANGLRSLLTMLGIIIGVLAVIVGTAIGQGSSQQVLARIQSLGSNSITIFPGQQRQGPVSGGVGSTQTLVPKDVKAITRYCPVVTGIAPQFSRTAQVKYLDKNTNTTITGTTPEFLPIRGFAVQEGRFFTPNEVRETAKVCVVGQTTAGNLFTGDVPLGQYMRIQGINFKIIGLLALKGAATFNDPDDQVVIPVTTAMTEVYGVTYYSNIYAQTDQADQAVEASNEIEAALRKSHRLRKNDPDDFNVRTQEEFLQLQSSSADTLTFLLSGIAAVALLVGGIGIMNIMLVSVTERTREIGLRKAVGARRGDILGQFLIEAATLSIMGGAIGVLGGFGSCWLVTKYLHFPTVISMVWVGIAFGSAAAIGLFFGFYPAYIAAQLDPIDALRYQ